MKTELIFRQRFEGEIYTFDIIINCSNAQNISSQVVGYAIVNLKTKKYYVSNSGLKVMTNQYLDEAAERYLKEGLEVRLFPDEGKGYARPRAEEIAIERLFEEAEEISKFFENSEE